MLTPGGARTVKRIPDQFIGTDLVIVKGLPWNYSASGVLMKKTGPRKRIAVAADEAEEGEKIPAKTGLITPRFAEKRKAEEPDEEGDPTATSSSSARAPAEAAAAAARPEPWVLTDASTPNSGDE